MVTNSRDVYKNLNRLARIAVKEKHKEEDYDTFFL